MDYQVKLEEFTGPLDLLLHLIKKSKVDICEIKIEEIIDQYLSYINTFEELNLDTASSYLVMASELILLKSKMLLPNEEIDDSDETLTKEGLINRLVEYEKYKEMTETFSDLEKERNYYYTKSPSSLTEYLDKNKEVVIENVTLEDLVKAMNQLFQRKEEEKPLSTKVTTQEISVEDRINYIKNILPKGEKKPFISLFEKKDKRNAIATFLAILEMASFHQIRIMQDNNFKEIYCEGVYE